MFKKHKRPWGYYQILFSNKYTKIKRIVIKSEQRLSYQYHNKRQEVWFIIKGKLTVVLDGNIYKKKPCQYIQIPLGAKHRAWNKTNKDVEFIEIQTGTYFGEDDIVRIHDDYKRVNT